MPPRRALFLCPTLKIKNPRATPRRRAVATIALFWHQAGEKSSGGVVESHHTSHPAPAKILHLFSKGFLPDASYDEGMKVLPLAFLVMVVSPLWADTTAPLAVPAIPEAVPAASPTPAAETPWSIAGKWDAHDAAWTGNITIFADGSFAWSNGTGGHWTLTGLQDHLVLVLAWNDWPAETLTMYGPSDFRGKTMHMERISAESGYSSNPIPSTPSPVAAPAPVDTPAAIPSPAAVVPWSIVGKWYCHAPAWIDTVTFSADGKFIRDQSRDTGRWTLTGLQDHVALIMEWDKSGWGKYVITMTSPNLFHEGDFTMQRVEPQVVAPVFGPIETRIWHQGEPPVRIMPQADGFCALSSVSGHFAGDGETVHVYIGNDGYWYLGDDSHQHGVSAECIVMRYLR